MAAVTRSLQSRAETSRIGERFTAAFCGGSEADKILRPTSGRAAPRKPLDRGLTFADAAAALRSRSQHTALFVTSSEHLRGTPAHARQLTRVSHATAWHLVSKPLHA